MLLCANLAYLEGGLAEVEHSNWGGLHVHNMFIRLRIVHKHTSRSQQHNYFFSTLQVVGPQTRIKQFPIGCHESHSALPFPQTCLSVVVKYTHQISIQNLQTEEQREGQVAANQGQENRKSSTDFTCV